MRQVITELDAMHAMNDYIAWRLETDLRQQYPQDSALIDQLIDALQHPANRLSPAVMKMLLVNTVVEFAEALAIQATTDNTEDLRLIRAFVNLVWDSPQGTAQWLRGQGVIVGQSAN